MTVMRDAIDTTTLGWIKPELDETMRHAREAIEAFAESSGDASRMKECAAHLHQVHGTLRMVELYAPAMVAEEMERLSLALMRGDVVDRDEACAVLMRGAVQLPDYLERLQGGHRDIPIVLLPLLNELRATRGEPGLNESVLFSPDLDRPLPEGISAPNPGMPSTQAGRQQLGALREALARWPEDGLPADAGQLARAVEDLLAEVVVEPLRRMLWVASSVAQAVRDGALQPSRALRQAFAGVEREVRFMLEGDGFSGPRDEAATEPTRQLLYHVAHHGATHPALDDLRRTFDLNAQLPSETEIEHARGSLSGRNRALLDTVSAAIKEDLMRVKDALDLYLRTGKTDISELRPQVEALGRVSDTLGMMGLGVARSVVQQQRDAMHEIVSGQRAADESALLDVAGALLYVDASLDDQVSRLGMADSHSDEDLLANEARRVLEVVVREAIANFGDARQAFVAFVETNWDHAELVDVPRLLDEVGGAVRMLDLQQPAEYLQAIRAYTQTELLGHRKVPNGQQLDTFADALASVEYYLEALREQRPNRERILDIARLSLEALGYWPLPLAATPSESESVLAEAEMPGPALTLADIAPDAVVTPTVSDTLASTVQDFVAPVTEPVASAPVANVGGFEHSDDIDDDIREVFLEELGEEIANLDALLPAWRAMPDDAEQLRPIRRVFHTLKGSGRLVGAKTLGEFSWKIENMLNRVLDGTRPATPPVIDLAMRAHAALPQLHAALAGAGVITADLAGMQAHADLLASGEEAFYVEREPVSATGLPPEDAAPAVEPASATVVDAIDAAVPADIAGPEAVVEPSVPASVDAVLLEILGVEVDGHLATIRNWLAAQVPERATADDALQRAIHTLNGAFAMTEVPVITGVTGPAEMYVKRLLAARLLPTDEGVAAMGEVADAIERTMASLQADVPRVPLFEGLAVRVAALRDSLPEARFTLADEELAAEYEAGDVAESGIPVAPMDLSDFIGDSALIDVERLEAERLEAERLEAERLEAERLEAERLEAERLEAERLEAERLEADRLEAERLEAERLEADRLEAERLEAERLEADRLEAERLEAERLEAERLEVERLEAERLEAGRLEAGRLEAERLAAERLEAERLEAERLEMERWEWAELDRLTAPQGTAEIGESGGDVELESDVTLADAALSEAEGRTEVADGDLVSADSVSDAEPSPEVAAMLAAAMGDIADPDEPLDLGDLDTELVDIFVEEGVDLLDHSDSLLAQLRETPTEREALAGLQRDLHTLKGGARMAGIMAVGDLGHVMESLLEAVVENRRELGRDGVPLLERGFDRLHTMVTRVGERRAIAMPSVLIAEFEARAWGEAPIGATAADIPWTDTVVPAEVEEEAANVGTPALTHLPPQAAAPLKPLSAPIGDATAVDEDDIGVRAPQEQVRIRADLLDRLVNYAGEVAIYRARLEQQLGAFRSSIAEMEQTNLRVRDLLRRLEIETEAQIVARYQREETVDATFDPLELDRFSTLQQLSRALAESAADQTSLQGTLDDLTRQYETLLLQQSRVSSELQEGLMRTRMVPFDGLLPRLRRVVRQAAAELGKQVQLKLEGTHGELDRNVLERMTAPLEHMLRNSVAHGLEKPGERRKAGKPDEGVIRIALHREGSEVVIEVVDDGRGLDRTAIRRRGEERGLVRPDAMLSDVLLDQLILEPGFSTATEVSKLAGRGVGMDVVASEVRQLGGTLDIHSTPGQGVNFTLRLPQTLAVTQAVFVKIGETTFAVPIASVSGVGRIARDQLQDEGASYRYGGEDYAIHDLGRLVGHAPAKAEGHMQMPVLLVRSGDLRAAVTIDQIVGNREIVVKPVGPQVASVPGIFGATIMGDGSVVVILDVAPLVRRQVVLPREAEPLAPGFEQRGVPLVMVVDDSITMRKVTGRVLERANFEVATAKDGLDALERMAEIVPDLMLLDIEMPRMDGYELATAMKADPRLRNVPIIMITSRTGEKHRERAFEIGVNRYLGKPYQEPELLRNVHDLLGGRPAS